MSKTANGLVEYCKAQIGKPYWWGTFGQTASASLLASKRAQYPGEYQAADFNGQFGQKVHDCVGLIKGYRWCDTPEGAPRYVGAQDVAVEGLYKQCSSGGNISTIPDIPGVCVFMADMGHVGVYVGNGVVIEAMGHAYGVVETALWQRTWARWGMLDWIDYGDAEKADTATGGSTIQTKPAYEYNVKLGLLKLGMKGEQIRTVQRLLIARGYSCGSAGADGEFGAATLAATKKFQKDKGLEADGEVGGDTWTKLLKG